MELPNRATWELHHYEMLPGHLLLSLLRLDSESLWGGLGQSGMTVAAVSGAVLTQFTAAGT